MTKLIVANLKSNHNLKMVEDWAKQVIEFLDQNDLNILATLAPPFPFLARLAEIIQGTKLSLAVQDLSPYKAGSYTGAVCGESLEGLNIDYAVLGHSERRHYFNETDQEVALKVKRSLQAGITPLLCVDEPFLESQLKALHEVFIDWSSVRMQVAMVYEPLTAIGSGQAAQTKPIQEMLEQIKSYYKVEMALYGGSVDASNVNDYLEIGDGVLVGTAAKRAESFIELLRAVK